MVLATASIPMYATLEEAFQKAFRSLLSEFPKVRVVRSADELMDGGRYCIITMRENEKANAMELYRIIDLIDLDSATGLVFSDRFPNVSENLTPGIECIRGTVGTVPERIISKAFF